MRFWLNRVLFAPEENGGGGGGGDDKDNTPVSRAEFGRVVDVLEKTNAAVSNLAKAVGQPAKRENEQPKQTERKPLPAEEWATSLFTEGDKPVRDVAREEATKVVSQLGPYFTEDAQNRASENLEFFRSTIDREFEEGTFEKLFVPVITERFQNDLAGLSLRSRVRDVVDQVRGRAYRELRGIEDRVAKAAAEKAEAEKKAAESREPPVMLGNGMRVPIDNGRVRLDKDDEDFVRRYEDNNGVEFDREMGSALLGAAVKGSQNQPHVKVSIKDLLAAGRRVKAEREKSQ